jgi:hypothetical protein
MVTESVTDLLCTGWLESLTLNVRDFAFAEAVGVPLITPVLDRLSPAGKVPVVIDHRYGIVPPVARRVAEYGVPTVPFGKDFVEIAKVWGLFLVAASRVETLRRMQIKAAADQSL